MTSPKHPVYALTTYELNERRSALERAIREIPPDTAVPGYLRNGLAEVMAEQDERARIRQAGRRNDNQDHYCVRQLTTAELKRVKRELQANLGLITDDSPAHVPIQAHVRAIDTELAERTGNHHAGGIIAMTMETEAVSADPLTALSSEYDAEWKVWHPGRYVADHRRLDITLISETASGLADKLRAFTDLLRDLGERL
jgi:hypothetical protein